MRRPWFLLLALCGALVPAGSATAEQPLVPETITAGYDHTCALVTAGKAWCWGWDESGEVGDGPANQDDKRSPTPVAGDRVYPPITAGAVVRDGHRGHGVVLGLRRLRCHRRWS